MNLIKDNKILLVLFVPQIILVLTKQSLGAMGIMLICSLVCAFFPTLDKYSKVKMSATGVELELREVINEATTTISVLKETVEPLINYSLASMITEDSAIEGTSPKDRVTLYKSVIQLNQTLGIESEYNKDLLTKSKAAILQSFYTKFANIIRSDDDDASFYYDKIREPFDIAKKSINTGFDITPITEVGNQLKREKSKKIWDETSKELTDFVNSELT